MTIDLLAGVMTALKWPNAKKLLLTREMIIAQCQKFHANEGVANKAPSHRRGMTHLSSSEK